MPELPTEDRSPDESEERRRLNLQCVGSFKAYTPQGECYTIEIWTHFGSMHDRERARVSPTKLYLMTTDGRDIDRVEQGEYRLVKNAEVTLTSDDPDAP